VTTVQAAHARGSSAGGVFISSATAQLQASIGIDIGCDHGSGSNGLTLSGGTDPINGSSVGSVDSLALVGQERLRSPLGGTDDERESGGARHGRGELRLGAHDGHPHTGSTDMR